MSSIVLRRFVTMSLACVAGASCDYAFATCGEPGRITVCAPMPDDPMPVCPGGNCNGTGGTGDGTWDGGNESGGDSNPNAMACYELARDGAPEGCDRSVALSTLNPLSGLAPSGMEELVFPGSDFLLNQTAEATAITLHSCYGDPQFTDAQCESDYYQSWAALEPYIPSSMQPAYRSMSFGLYAEINFNQQDRAVASWFGQFSLSYGVFEVNVSLLGHVLMMGKFNQALIASSRQTMCQMFFGAWDQNGCGG